MENKPLELTEALELIREQTSYTLTEEVLSVYVRRITTQDSYERYLWNYHKEIKRGHVNYISNIIKNDDSRFKNEKRLLQ